MFFTSNIQSRGITIDKKYKTVQPLALEIEFNQGKQLFQPYVDHLRTLLEVIVYCQSYFYLGRNAILFRDSHWRFEIGQI